MGKLNSSLFSSKDQTWGTPLDLFGKIDKEYNFELDVCAVDETAKCKRYFTPEIDGLSQKWGGLLLDESSLWERTNQMDNKSI